MTTATKIPVNSIVIPESFVDLCKGWSGDTGCMLYAVSSTGNLTIGTIRPGGCDCDEQWYYSIWLDLSVDVAYNRRLAGNDHEDYPTLVDFEHWVDKQCDRLCESYGLDEWERN